jgi:hypothetical protein
MAKTRKDTQKITEQDILNELDYLIKEGFAVYNSIDQTYRMKTEEELENDIKNV